MKQLDEILQKVQSMPSLRLAVAAAEDEALLLALKQAAQLNLIQPILVGDLAKIGQILADINFNVPVDQQIAANSLEDSAQRAVALISEGNADFLMKGLLDTSILLKAVLKKEAGLRKGGQLSHVMVYDIPTYHKLILMTDGGMSIAPDLATKKDILLNGVDVARALDIHPVHVACIAAKEKPNDKMPATTDARALQEWAKDQAQLNDVIVEGPLAIDLALSKEAADKKGFSSKVAGEADMLLVPFIEVGNAVGKTLTYLAKAESAGIIVGTKVPVVLASRADDMKSKLYSIALGSLIAHQEKTK